jgi:hypothetical protein
MIPRVISSLIYKCTVKESERLFPNTYKRYRDELQALTPSRISSLMSYLEELRKLQW